MKESIDARTLPCPQPVIKVKKAFDKGGFQTLEVRVDNLPAVENITRFCDKGGHKILSVNKSSDTDILITIENAASTPADAAAEGTAAGAGSDAATSATAGAKEETCVCTDGPGRVFVNSFTLGSGDDKLGAKLMETFFFSLTEAETLPSEILMMNGGVKHAVEGSASLKSLKELEEMGVKILVCGACLDFYGIKEKLQAGKISNMYELSSYLLAPGNTVTMG